MEENDKTTDKLWKPRARPRMTEEEPEPFVLPETKHNITRGWLVNPHRKERRDRPVTLTDHQVMALISKIDSIKEYTRLRSEIDQLLRTRNKALIALAWTFFKRAGENLRLKIGDFYSDENELLVTFHISKKAKTIKICPVSQCRVINAKNAVYCKACGEPIQYAPMKKTGREAIVTKRKTMQYSFCRTFVEWIKKLKDMDCQDGYYVFPRWNNFANTFIFVRSKAGKEGHITVQRFDQILQRLDDTLTSHMFRYGHTEKLLRLGYSPFDLTEIGDWESSHMPEVYAKRKGLTPSQRRFAQDVRIT